MTAEQLYKDRKTFSERVKEVAEEQLKELGLELKSFTIKGIGDQNGYFEALSKPQIAAVKRDAEIAQAEAIKESMIKTSEAKRAGEQAVWRRRPAWPRPKRTRTSKSSTTSGSARPPRRFPTRRTASSRTSP